MDKKKREQKRRKRVRATLKGTGSMPRLSLYRSARYLYSQLIDDEKGVTLIGVSEKHLAKANDKKQQKTQRGKELGLLMAKKATEKNIKAVRFDRGSYKYHGRVKAFAEGAREGGLQF